MGKPDPQSTSSGSHSFSHSFITAAASAATRNIFPIWALGLYRRLVLLGHSRVAAAAANGSSGSNGRAAAAEGAVLAPGTGWLCAISDFVSTSSSSSSKQ